MTADKLYEQNLKIVKSALDDARTILEEQFGYDEPETSHVLALAQTILLSYVGGTVVTRLDQLDLLIK